MPHVAFVDLIRATFDSWRSARAAGNDSAMEGASDQLVWLARESVKVVRDTPSDGVARSALLETLGPVADEIAEVAEVLRKAGWR